MSTTEQKQQEWLDTTITLAGVKATYPGKKLGETGLGYWIGEEQGEPTFYVPSYVLSGYKASSATFFSEDICKQFIVELSQLMNWNRPLAELVKDPAYQPEQFNALAIKFWIEDAASTAAGGRW